ncbi:hypothetical protein F7725_021978 [Dissostichus mawsoni]|uniref:Uncharacterized protein n=1 Tax=Dissostichus mawsoni TaxID=36200 RepID=A0A7J5ZEZ2_DISMA|nr:hypothetical protein F7725_021978 [Dissostichus mawsoni]
METPGPEHDEYFDFLFKIILIGDSNVGKTCLVQNFKSGIFQRDSRTPLEWISPYGPWISRGRKLSAHGAIIAYDITRQGTFDSVTHWIKEVEIYGANNVVLVLIGNKCDLEKERQVQFEEACNLSKEKEILAALETSAKESQNVEEAFIMMAESCCLVTASMSSRRTRRGTTRLESSSGPTLGR